MAMLVFSLWITVLLISGAVNGQYSDNSTNTFQPETTTGTLSYTTSFTKPSGLSTTTTSGGNTLANFNCSFQTDFCGWKQSKRDDFDWTRHQGPTASTYTGPKFDHTTRSLGYFAYIESSNPRKPGETAMLTYFFKDTISSGCLSLYYHMYGQHIGSLNVAASHGTSKLEELWSQTGNLGDKWHHVIVPILQPVDTMAIIGVVGIDFQGDIAIDDVTYIQSCFISNNNIDKNISTTIGELETTTGVIADITSSSLPTVRNTTTTPTTTTTTPTTTSTTTSTTTAPTTTSTTTTPTTTSTTTTPTTTSTTTTPTTTSTTTTPTTTSTTTTPTTTSTTTTPTTTSTTTTPTTTSTTTTTPTTTSTTTTPTTTSTTTTPTTTSTTTTPTITNTTTAALPAVPANFSCTFQSDFCGWRQDILGDRFDWRRARGKTPTGKTGPSFDHTKLNYDGWYAFIEASSPRRPGDTARLIYTLEKPISGGCFSMYYHMYGSGMGSLRVAASFGKGKPIQLWNKTGNVADKWQHVNVPILQTVDEITITGVRGYEIYGDIAIDDLTYVPSCSAGNSSQTVSKPIDLSKSLNCTFDKSFCGWKQSNSDQFDWRWWKDSTPSSSTGPTKDHTTGKGHYMYIEATRNDLNNKAVLEHKFETAVSKGCFSMWYHMYGEGIGSLQVNSDGSDKTHEYIWTKSGPQGDKWFQASIPITRKTTIISITGVIGPDYHGDIAIDDVSYTSNDCDNTTGSQALDVLDCSFDINMCRWKQEKAGDEFDWIRQKGSTSSIGTGPDDDHLTGQGQYLYIESSPPRKTKDWATIFYTFTKPASGGCLSLYYHMYGSGIGSLTVSAQSNQKTETIAAVYRDQGYSWKELRALLPNPTNIIKITASILNPPMGDIAIDDITFTTGPCPLDPRQVQRLEFVARYSISCDVMFNPVSRDMLITSARDNGVILQQICDTDCNAIAKPEPLVGCENNKLVIRWASNTTYKADTTAIPAATAKAISDRIQQRGKDIFKIIIGSRMPPIVYPTPNADGTSVEMVLNPFCTGGSKYSEMVKTCV